MAPHRVEFFRYGRWNTSTFDTARDAYQFWLFLRIGTSAKLYQDGALVGEGDGRGRA